MRSRAKLAVTRIPSERPLGTQPTDYRCPSACLRTQTSRPPRVGHLQGSPSARGDEISQGGARRVRAASWRPRHSRHASAPRRPGLSTRPDPELDRRLHRPRRQRLGARLGAYCEEEPGPASSSHGAHCHLAVMRGQLRFELARSVAAASLWLVPTHLRFSAAQAATRFTKSSKPKQGRRPSLSK